MAWSTSASAAPAQSAAAVLTRTTTEATRAEAAAAKMILDIAHTVQCSREARRALARGLVPVTYLDILPVDEERALHFPEERPDHDDPGFAAYNAARRQEFDELFKSGLDPANNELAPARAAAILRGLDIRGRFVDLGSARGSFALAAAERCEAAAGVELSRISHKAALARGGNVEFVQGDLRTFDASSYDVLYCAIRGPVSRPRILREFLEFLLSRDFENPKRLICAGFGIDLRGESYEHQLTLQRAYCFGDTSSFYGDQGPRVLLEYLIAPTVPPRP